MTKLALYPNTSRCPRCSFSLAASTTVCENCKSFVPLEEADQGSLAGIIKIILGRRLSDLLPHEIAFILACIPLLIGPPVAALIIAGVKILQDYSHLDRMEWRKPIAIAAVNIAVSLVIWRYAATQMSGVALDAVIWLRMLFDAGQSGFKLTPV